MMDNLLITKLAQQLFGGVIEDSKDLESRITDNIGDIIETAKSIMEKLGLRTEFVERSTLDLGKVSWERNTPNSEIIMRNTSPIDLTYNIDFTLGFGFSYQANDITYEEFKNGDGSLLRELNTNYDMIISTSVIIDCPIINRTMSLPHSLCEHWTWRIITAVCHEMVHIYLLDSNNMTYNPEYKVLHNKYGSGVMSSKGDSEAFMIHRRDSDEIVAHAVESAVQLKFGKFDINDNPYLLLKDMEPLDINRVAAQKYLTLRNYYLGVISL